MESSNGMPLTHHKIVDEDAFFVLTQRLKNALPEDIKKATELARKTASVVENANSEAKRMVTDAQNEAQHLVGDARSQAERAVEDARSRADRMVEQRSAAAWWRDDAGDLSQGEPQGRLLRHRDRRQVPDERQSPPPEARSE